MNPTNTTPPKKHGRVSKQHRDILYATQRAGEKNEINAGFQSPARDHMDRELCLDEYLIRNPNATFYLRAEGEKHRYGEIQDGDLLIVDRAKSPCHGNMVVTSMADDLRVHRFVAGPAGDGIENAGGKRIPLQNQDDIKIWGVINYVIHKV